MRFSSIIKLVFVLFSHLIWAQSPSSSSFLSITDEDGLPLPAVQVQQTLLENKQAVQQKLAITNLEGKVPLLFQGMVALNISFVGFKSIEDTVSTPQNNKNYTLQEDVLNLNEVVITAQFQSNTAEEAVHRVKVINRERIEQQAAVTLNDILKLETNIRLEQDNILGSSMSVQGVSGENVKILIDGVPIIGRQNGSVDLSQINLDNIERIEIIEGPLSVNYGTNALGGTINLITKDSQAKTFDLDLNTYYESVGQYNVNGALGYKKGKHFVNVSGGRNFFDGWSPEDTSRFQQWKPKEQYFGRAQYSIKWDNTTLRWTGEVFNEKITNKGQPRAPFYETAYDDYYRTLRVDNNLFLKHHFKNGNNLDFTAAYNYYQRKKNNYYVDLTTLNKELTTDPQEQDTSVFDLVMSRATYNIVSDSSKLNLQLGYDIAVESARGERIEGTTQQIGDYALFANAEWKPITALTIRPGVRFAYNTSYKAPIIPSVNVKYAYKKSAFRFSYAMGFRSPSIKELYFYFVDSNHNIQGNPDLEAETSSNYQLFWTRNSDRKQKHQLKTELGFFFNNIKNLITLAATSTLSEYTYININKYQTTGIQANITYQIKQLSLTLGGTYTGIKDEFDEAQDYSSVFHYSPEVRTHAVYEFEKLGASLAFFYKYTGKLRRYYQSESGTVYAYFIEGYHTCDFTASKNLFKKKLVLAAGVKNLFDVQNIYASNSGGGSAHAPDTGSAAMAWGRSYFLQLRINL